MKTFAELLFYRKNMEVFELEASQF